MTSSNGNIFRITGHLCGKFTGHWWIPHTNASDVELRCFLWSILSRPRCVQVLRELVDHFEWRHPGQETAGSRPALEGLKFEILVHILGFVQVKRSYMKQPRHIYYHYSDVIMTAMASQLNRLFRRRSKKKNQSSALLALCEGNLTSDRWIPHTKG